MHILPDKCASSVRNDVELGHIDIRHKYIEEDHHFSNYIKFWNDLA